MKQILVSLIFFATVSTVFGQVIPSQPPVTLSTNFVSRQGTINFFSSSSFILGAQNVITLNPAALPTVAAGTGISVATVGNVTTVTNIGDLDPKNDIGVVSTSFLGDVSKASGVAGTGAATEAASITTTVIAVQGKAVPIPTVANAGQALVPNATATAFVYAPIPAALTATSPIQIVGNVVSLISPVVTQTYLSTAVVNSLTTTPLAPSWSAVTTGLAPSSIDIIRNGATLPQSYYTITQGATTSITYTAASGITASTLDEVILKTR